jgi:hypothetical protein
MGLSLGPDGTGTTGVAALMVIASPGLAVYGGSWIRCQLPGRLDPLHALGRVALPRYWLPPVPCLNPALCSCLVGIEADARRVHRSACAVSSPALLGSRMPGVGPAY